MSSIIEHAALCWARVTADIFYKIHEEQTPLLMADTNRQMYADAWIPAKPGWVEYTVVLLTLSFLYMLCYLIFKYIEDIFIWLKIRRENKRLRANQQLLDDDDSIKHSTP